MKLSEKYNINELDLIYNKIYFIKIKVINISKSNHYIIMVS